MRQTILLLFLVVSCVLSGTEACAEGVLIGGGDIEFYLDVASIPTGDARTLALFQIAVPTKEIEYKEKDGRYHAAVRVKIVLRDGDKLVHQKGYVIRDDQDRRPVPEDLSSFYFLVDSLYVEPGEYLLSVEVEDESRRKKTLFGLLGKKYLSSSLEDIPVDVRSYPVDAVALGDPILIWDMKPSRGDVAFTPNPMQIFGLKNDTLSFYTAARAPDSDSITVYFSVFDGAGEVQGEEDLTVAVVDGHADIFGSFDLNTYPSGTYRVLIEAFDRGGLSAANGKDFSVAWELMNWQKPRRDILVEARILLSDAEYAAFQEMSLGEQERMMNDFWKRIDPTPHTALNEKYETFVRRLRSADNRFGGDVRGALTDRGMIFIKYGQPDDIVNQSIPKTREDMTEALEKLEDEYKVIAFSSQTRGPGAGEYPKIQSRTPTDTRMSDGRPFRGVGMDSGGFELWIYNVRGEPLLERDRIMTVHTGLRFLFVDKDGIGSYRLVGTSEELQDTE